jgi:SAM-dependent MidA family methyltransferase
VQRGFELPTPDDEALSHSGRVAEFIAGRIRAAGGWMDFADYMDLALYAPGLGYYCAGSSKLGPSGDFVTASVISPLFGRCLANACRPWLRSNPGSAVLEIGAGTGALAAELLESLERGGTHVVRYLILDVSADLRERQRATLDHLPARMRTAVRWLDALPATPERAIVIANEVADALPVTRFVKWHGGVMAQGVTVADGRFAWAMRPAGPELKAAVAAIEEDLGAVLPEGYASEVSLRLPAWIRALAGALETGVVLICDYGMSRREYYHPERRDGTLICHYRHRAHDDPFLYPGLQDLSAWVDFTAVAQAARAAGLRLAGYSTQAHFLMDTGLGEELAAMTPGIGRASVEVLRQAKTLLLPGEMGERFKVMALARGEATLGGFGFRDLSHML